jgi:hypothetical protein
MMNEIQLFVCNTNRILFSGYAEKIDYSITREFIHFDIAGVHRVPLATVYQYAFKNIQIDIVDWDLLRAGNWVKARIRYHGLRTWDSLGMLAVTSFVQSPSRIDELILIGRDCFTPKKKKPSQETVQWMERWHKRN